MTESVGVVKGYAPIKGLCPESKKQIDFLLSIDFARQVQRHQPYWKFMAIDTLEQVLCSPAWVYSGLQRDGYDDGYCYFGSPDKYYRSPGIETDFPKEFLLGVSVHWDQRGFIILDWEKRRVDGSGKPLGAETDFGGLKCISN